MRIDLSSIVDSGSWLVQPLGRLVLVMSLLAFNGQATPLNGQVLPQLSDPDQLLSEISQHVETSFYDRRFDTDSWREQVERIRSEVASSPSLDAFDRSLNQLIGNLNASHTYFFSRNNPKRYQLLGIFHALFDANHHSLFQYCGAGLDTRVIDGRTMVVSVYDGLPADRAGLRFGDQIVSVEGEPFHPMNSFHGKAGQPITFQIRRGATSIQLEIIPELLDGRTMFESALRDSIRVIERDGRRIGYLHAWSYAGTKYQEMIREALVWGKLSQCDGLVLDIRDGWGGADINYLNLFRQPIARVQSLPRTGDEVSFSGVWGEPVVLLTNRRSTSGKELLSYGFKKLKLGTVVGTPTAGAVLAGRCILLDSQDVLYLATADVRIDGQRLEGKGVRPDVLVERPIQAEPQGDPQLKSALKLLLEKIESPQSSLQLPR